MYLQHPFLSGVNVFLWAGGILFSLLNSPFVMLALINFYILSVNGNCSPVSCFFLIQKFSDSKSETKIRSSESEHM